ncbi:amidohydrolase family protein [Rhodopirellula sp. P2]|uniref:amidohydrolase family protein n=1 Tax=Rhodopirellula sp. P2 TaxID=2127060 RepID=UPI00236863B7|nr:amidohydrolase family protein [Rhodopirellula sp. P2]WDQ16220.1 amidohydrolase family protein [Rhodopirellula sp. P2]
MLTISVACLAVVAHGQDLRGVAPVVGLRTHSPTDVLLTGATLVANPDHYLKDLGSEDSAKDADENPSTGDVLIRAGRIVAVSDSIEPPPGCRVVDCSGKTIYAGWINAWQEVPSDSLTSGDDYWNANIVANREVRDLSSVPDAGKLRSQGFTTTVLAPKGRIIGGQPSVWSLNESKDDADNAHAGPQRIADLKWMTAALSVPRGNDSGERYPNSPMGAVALLRQSLYDAQWYRDASAAHDANPSLPQPDHSETLQTLHQALVGSTFVFDCPNERMALRAQKIANEFALRSIVRGSGREYREAEAIAALDRVLLLPLDFPEAPDVATPESAREVDLVNLMDWKFAPTNPAEMIRQGATICLTTDRLEDPGKFLARLRTAVKRGLSRRDAIAALTTTPAGLLGLERSHGRIAAGMSANLIVASGDLFEKDTKVWKVLVDGQEFVVNEEPETKVASLVGTWKLRMPADSATQVELSIEQKDGRLSAELIGTTPTEETNEESVGGEQASDKADDEESDADGDSDLSDEAELEEQDSDEKQKEEPKEQTSKQKLKKIVQRLDQFAAQITCDHPEDALCQALGLPAGTHRVVIRSAAKALEEVSESEPLSIEFYPIGKPARRFETSWVEPETDETPKEEPADEETSDDKDDEGDQVEDSKDADAEKPAEGELASSEPEQGFDASDAEEPVVDELQLVRPLGVYGRREPVAPVTRVLFQGALVWTCEDRDDLRVPETPMDILVEDGRIVAVDEHIAVPVGEDCTIIDAAGKHITPGLIDCHSHAATDGGINESGQVVTSEVRVGDFIDHTDITIYRQLAGGVTTANILHGSANPIGGQNQVVKFRWGDSMDDFRFQDAPLGIKFALGENVKRNTSRYPNTRMGVEQLLRDQFLAAREYAAAHRRWSSGQRDTLPPRVDLQLQTLVEIQDGKRWIHCHSYRQDEIMATLDVLDEFGIRIGSLQHILEGYKVADRMVEHGAMASSFADWWAYKFEVYDAIPYNGVLMHNKGIVVSYNSDDAEMGRHLNTEAGKAIKYGGVPPTEALKFVTLNPAKQLRIEDRVGSIEVGKDADLVVWSGPPMSTTSRCEQTWIDGRPMFRLEDEAKLRARDEAWRNELIQELLDGKPKSDSDEPTEDDDEKASADHQTMELEEEDRWLRYDEYCNSRGAQQSVQQNAQQAAKSQRSEEVQ